MLLGAGFRRVRVYLLSRRRSLFTVTGDNWVRGEGEVDTGGRGYISRKGKGGGGREGMGEK